MTITTDYDQLAEEIRAKRQYREEEDGTVFCSISGCPGSTGLRCRRTEVPICPKCSVRTEVGYISKEAAREQQNKFFDAATTDYIIAGFVAFFANLVVGFFVTRLGFLGLFGLILIFFVGTSAGGVMSEVIWRAIRKRRGRYTGRIAGAGIILSSIVLFPFTPNILALLLYAFVVLTTVNARFQLGLRL
jgi:hypothetical protein